LRLDLDKRMRAARIPLVKIYRAELVHANDKVRVSAQLKVLRAHDRKGKKQALKDSLSSFRYNCLVK